MLVLIECCGGHNTNEGENTTLQEETRDLLQVFTEVLFFRCKGRLHLHKSGSVPQSVGGDTESAQTSRHRWGNDFGIKECMLFGNVLLSKLPGFCWYSTN